MWSDVVQKVDMAEYGNWSNVRQEVLDNSLAVGEVSQDIAPRAPRLSPVRVASSLGEKLIACVTKWILKAGVAEASSTMISGTEMGFVPLI